MFELSPKLRAAKVVISWIPDADFFPEGVTFVDPALSVTIEVWKNSKVRDDDPSAMLYSVPHISADKLIMSQVIQGGVVGATYVLTFLADFSDGVQRDGVRALIEVE